MLERVTKDEESFDESTEVDLARLPAKDRDAIMARVTPDDSTPSDAFALAQNEIRREVQYHLNGVKLQAYMRVIVIMSLE
jgi:hypothetical protein